MNNPVAAAVANVWTITPQEHQQNEMQFLQLQPVQGQIGGDQARPFFLKSGLAPAALAQIWQLADLNKDGRLDKWEFSIALKLVRNALSGLPIPTQLPDSMRQLTNPMPTPPMSFGAPFPPRAAGSMSAAQTPLSGPYQPHLQYGGGGGFTSIPSTPQHSIPPPRSMSRDFTGAPPSQQQLGGGGGLAMAGTREIADWSLPQHLKLRFSQQFNHLDRQRVGLLNGQQARGVLGESQLPTSLLAHVWNMSDVNRDGCLSIEEFCIAMFLIERAKEGFRLPAQLPPELATICGRSKTASPHVTTIQQQDPTAPPPQKTPALKTFEDKRRDNLDRGEAELERRRQVLREEEDRRRAEVERKEREEAARREKEREEAECRREAEREAERQREQARERERTAEEARHKAEREETRRRLEQERMAELERMRVKELEAKVQAEKEKTEQILQRQQTMRFQLQALDERSHQLNGEITVARDEILGITHDIEEMRESRDTKLARIRELQSRQQQLAVQCERVGHENLQLQSHLQHAHSRQQEADELRTRISTGREALAVGERELEMQRQRLENQERQVGEKRAEAERTRRRLEEVAEVYNAMVDRLQQLQRDANQRVKQQQLRKRQSEDEGGKLKQQASMEEVVGGGGGDVGVEQNTGKMTSSTSLLYNVPPDATAIATAGGGDGRRTSDTTQLEGSTADPFFKPNFAEAFGSNNSSTTTTTIQPQPAAPTQVQVHQPTGGQKATTPFAAVHGEQQGATAVAPIATASQGGQQLVKYRALYEFVARSDDELSIQPGDILVVFEGHVSEPGWLAGQIKQKIGWFPAAFAEPLHKPSPTGGTAATSTAAGSTAATASGGGMTNSSSGEPLASIKEEESSAGMGTGGEEEMAGGKQQPMNAVAAQALPMYDAPPGDEPSSTKAKGPTTTKTSQGAAITGVPTTITTSTPANKTKAEEVGGSSFPPPSTNAPSTTTSSSSLIGTALYQWKARNATELSFNRHDVIEVLEKAEMRWRGRLQRDPTKEGWFPKSYIKLRGDGEATPTAPTSETKGEELKSKASKQSAVVKKQGSVTSTTSSTSSSSQQPKQPPTAQRSLSKDGGVGGGGGGGDWYVALYQFDAVEPSDLSLRMGERIQVVEAKDEWWKGRTIDGREGIFPANYVKKEETDQPIIAKAIAAFEATESNQLALRVGDVVRVHTTSPGGWWEGELQDSSDTPTSPTATRQSGWFPGNYVQKISSSTSTAASGGGNVVLGTASFDYAAQRSDELSFKQGEVLEVVEHSPDTQWWRGRRQAQLAVDGKEDASSPASLGYFPSSYVKLHDSN